MSDRQTVAGAIARADSAHQKIDDHEKLCAERYGTINTTLGELKDAQKNQGRVAVGILLTLIGWLAIQVWDGRNSPPKEAQPHAHAEQAK